MLAARVPVIVIVLCAAAAEGSQNKLVNGAFGSSLASWNLFEDVRYPMTQTGSVGHDAPGAYQITSDGTSKLNTQVMWQCVAVAAGAAYTASGYFRFAAGATTVPSGFLMVQWATSTNCNSNTLLPGLPQTNETTNLPATWQLVTGPFVAPVGAKSALLEVVVKSTSAAPFQAWYDDLAFFGGVKGDATGDGAVGVVDVFHLVNWLFAAGPLPIGPCDVNSDDAVTVLDVFYLVNFLFAAGNPPL
jgi:hypothetical protein